MRGQTSDKVSDIQVNNNKKTVIKIVTIIKHIRKKTIIV